MNSILPSKRRMTLRTKRAFVGYMFILPFILGFLLFTAKPMFESLRMSFSEVNPRTSEMSWVALKNYDYALNNIAWFRQTIVEQIGEMGIITVSTMVLSFVVAVVLNANFHGRTAARIVFFLPVIMSSGVLLGLEQNMMDNNVEQTMMVSMSDAMQQSGGVDLTTTLKSLLQSTGVATQAFQIVFDIIDGIYDVAVSSGIQIIIFLSGMQTIPSSLYEAAHVEGCSAWESFWMITFPMVSPLLLVNAVYTITDFATRSDNEIMEKVLDVMYLQYDFGLASSISWLYLAISVAMIGVAAFIIKRGVKNLD